MNQTFGVRCVLVLPAINKRRDRSGMCAHCCCIRCRIIVLVSVSFGDDDFGDFESGSGAKRSKREGMNGKKMMRQ